LEKAEKIIQRSMANNWAGIFELPKNDIDKNALTDDLENIDYKDRTCRRYAY
jgi:hypothetical protein